MFTNSCVCVCVELCDRQMRFMAILANDFKLCVSGGSQVEMHSFVAGEMHELKGNCQLCCFVPTLVYCQVQILR